jgi:hypothetical protein
MDDSPIFYFHVTQFFVEDIEQFKKGIHHDNESSVMVGFSDAEFGIIVEEILAYKKELEASRNVFDKLVKAGSKIVNENKPKP